MHKFYFKYFYAFLIQYSPLINRRTKNNCLDYQQVTNNTQSFIKIFW